MATKSLKCMKVDVISQTHITEAVNYELCRKQQETLKKIAPKSLFTPED